ncbi:BnaC04g13720D [Brassica napus]|uniref:BnaC04g13720D protein n=1 Tax=Brassica napus TaxID=3708 RepID=A0A078I879_BRANA|nr:BnaC04g13720D [Brassica napus]
MPPPLAADAASTTTFSDREKKNISFGLF